MLGPPRETGTKLPNLNGLRCQPGPGGPRPPDPAVGGLPAAQPTFKHRGSGEGNLEIGEFRLLRRSQLTNNVSGSEIKLPAQISGGF